MLAPGGGRLRANWADEALECFLFLVCSLNPMDMRSSSISSSVNPLVAMVLVVGGVGVRGAAIEVCCGFSEMWWLMSC